MLAVNKNQEMVCRVLREFEIHHERTRVHGTGARRLDEALTALLDAKVREAGGGPVAGEHDAAPSRNHHYPGVEAADRGDDFFTSDCTYGCGCWMGASRSGGPDGVDPFGACPNAPSVDHQSGGSSQGETEPYAWEIVWTDTRHGRELTNERWRAERAAGAGVAVKPLYDHPTPDPLGLAAENLALRGTLKQIVSAPLWSDSKEELARQALASPSPAVDAVREVLAELYECRESENCDWTGFEYLLDKMDELVDRLPDLAASLKTPPNQPQEESP